jgi:hypothetical protein
MASTIVAGNITNGGTAISSDSTGILDIKTGTGSGTTALTIDASQNVTAANNLNATGFTSASTFGFKNRIINGAMVIDQRNAGASVTLNNSAWSFAVDRFGAYENTDGVMTAQQSTTVPTAQGFTNSIIYTTTTADSSLSATQYVCVRQCIEGNNVSDFGFGAANAATVTLSFWVRSSLTGTFGGCLRNGSGNRTYVYSYTISAANTWEKKTITISGDTSGTWATNNTSGLEVWWSLGSGSNYQGTVNTWNAGDFYTVAGETPVIGTLNATFYITGVQLEKGSAATSFDYRPYTTEFQLCQRYFQEYLSTNGAIFRANGSTGQKYYWMPFSTAMRANPTMSVGTPTYYNMSAASWGNAGQDGSEIFVTASGADGYVFVPWTASAEL